MFYEHPQQEGDYITNIYLRKFRFLFLLARPKKHLALYLRRVKLPLYPLNSRRVNLLLPKQIYGFVIILMSMMLACGSGPQNGAIAPPTRTPLPTFTSTSRPALLPTDTPVSEATPTATNTPVLPSTNTPVPTTLPSPTDTPLPEATFTPAPTSPPPTDTPLPPPTDTPTVTPTPEPVIKYVLAGSHREFNCDFTYIHGTVKNANSFGIPDVEVRALGIHESTGLDFVTHTDAEGNYEIFRVPLSDLQAAQWAVILMENGAEVSERFHWASTPVCQSDDTGHSQVLRVDWKLIE
jgi:hypothetical protein